MKMPPVTSVQRAWKRAAGGSLRRHLGGLIEDWRPAVILAYRAHRTDANDVVSSVPGMRRRRSSAA
jgi:hypothetical protein